MSSFLYINDKVKDILIAGEGPAQPNRSLQEVYTIMEATVSYLLVIQKYINSKQKTLKSKIIHCV